MTLQTSVSNQSKDFSDVRNWSLFTHLTEPDFKEIEHRIKKLSFQKDEVVFRPDDSATGMYFMMAGRIKISKLMPDGKAQILYIYNPGDFVGGLNLLSGDKYFYLGETLEESTIGYIPKAIFDKYALQNIESLHKILAKSYDRIRWAEDLITRLSTSNAEIKVAGLLLSLIDPYGKIKNDVIHLNLTITREEMGSYAGLTRETMTRKLNDFKNRGLVDFIGNHTIIIKDINALRQLIYLG